MAPATNAQPAILPISELSSYAPKWTIRARVTEKAPLRTFARGANTGKVFHVNLLDAQGGEIRASLFNEAVDQHFDKLQIGKVYTFSKGSIRVANKQYNSLNHRYELSFDKATEIIEVADNADIEAFKLTVTDLRSVQARQLPFTVDLCGIITNAGPVVAFTSKDGKELVKREVALADDSGLSMQVTLWGDRAKQGDEVFQGSPVMALKGVLVKEWNGGRSGSVLQGGALILKPDLPEAQKLQQWWSHGGSEQTFTSISELGGVAGVGRAIDAKVMDLAQMRRASSQLGEQTEHYSIPCRVAIVQTKKQGEQQPLFYMACQEPRERSSLACNRRVDSSGFCAACNRAGKAAPRLNIRVRVSDCEDSAWLTTFHEAAQEVLGLSAEQVQEMETNDREGLEALLATKYFDQPLQVTLRAKLDTYNGEIRQNITCIGAKPVSRSDRGKLLLSEISDMLAAR